MKKRIIIPCPKCKAEYLPCEIFIPQSFLGDARNIVKDNDGHILDYDRGEMDTEETYICDKCGATLRVKCKILFSVDERTNQDFDSAFISSIKEENIEFAEDEFDEDSDENEQF